MELRGQRGPVVAPALGAIDQHGEAGRGTVAGSMQAGKSNVLQTMGA